MIVVFFSLFKCLKTAENCCFLGRNPSTNISYAGSQSFKTGK